MFDVGFWEVALIGVIALLVVGPERLPALARNVGLWVGRLRRYVNHVKQDIEREIHADEMRELIRNPGSASSGLSELNDVARETASAVDDLKRGLSDAAKEGENAFDQAAGTTPRAGDPRPEDPAVATDVQAALPEHAQNEEPSASPEAGSQAQESIPQPVAEPHVRRDPEVAAGVGPGPDRGDDEHSLEPTRRD